MQLGRYIFLVLGLYQNLYGLRAVDKEFSLPANYPKGHGDMFKYWLELNHPGALLVPVERSSGSRQDLACEGAAAVYWNRK